MTPPDAAADLHNAAQLVHALRLRLVRPSKDLDRRPGTRAYLRDAADSLRRIEGEILGLADAYSERPWPPGAKPKPFETSLDELDELEASA